MIYDFWQAELVFAKEHATFGRNEAFLELSTRIASTHSNDIHIVLQVSHLQSQFGFLSYAKKNLMHVLKISANHRSALIALAIVELQLGNVNICIDIQQQLIKNFPNDLKILSQSVYISDYLPNQSDDTLSKITKRWGNAAILNSKHSGIRPDFRILDNEPLKIGYVSADFCQHTVGVLFKEILAHHDTKYFSIFCYSAGNVKDHITIDIASRSKFLDVSNLSDLELAKQISIDRIDILIDLSGHTGGSRLSSFAYRPAPVMVSMLGYYASTGLPYIDAFLLDPWHVHEGIQFQFIEPIVQLPYGKWCYHPAFSPFMEKFPPSYKNNYITFGSFNNTLKYNSAVFALWAKLLHAVPNSKLLLKWRTLNDPSYRQFVIDQFHLLGIETSRLDLRGPSFHQQMLEEYKDIDIALDPFPFSGGVTSCEALYMGVPVVTMPRKRVVSRQTYAFLSLINHHELVAHNETEYIEIAKTLANNPLRLTHYRESLRTDMLNSPLMNIKAYTKSLESALYQIYQDTRSRAEQNIK
jgi:protein O-GlcNAc transferase